MGGGGLCKEKIEAGLVCSKVLHCPVGHLRSYRRITGHPSGLEIMKG